jgi:hypothetical protein
MTYEEYKRDIEAKRQELRGFMVNPNEKPLSAVEFIENSAKTAKIINKPVKTAKWGLEDSKFGKCMTAGEHLDKLRGLEAPVTTEEKMKAWRKGHTDSTPEPNAAFARMKKDEWCKRLAKEEPKEPNKDNNLAMAKLMLEEMEEADDDYDDMMDEWHEDRWTGDD